MKFFERFSHKGAESETPKLSDNFQKLVKSQGYQVFLFICPAFIPCHFALHPWFVCVKDGNISRWEVRFEKNYNNPDIGKHLHLIHCLHFPVSR